MSVARQQNSDVPNGIEVGLRVHDAPIQDHDIEVVRVVRLGLVLGGRA
ncbi:MAG: hypothetical protein WAU39_14170 [Polyangiales bacterium]